MFRGRGSLLGRPVALFVVALSLAACAVARTPGEKTAEDYGATDVPTVVQRPTRTKPPGRGVPVPNSVKNRKGSFEITVTSPSGTALAGVNISYTGAEHGTMRTDAGGVATRTVKPGAYALEVENCGTEIHVTLGGGADLTVVAGQTTRGVISGIAWEPRFQPFSEVRASVPPPWRIGVPFTLKTRVGDRCREGAPATQPVTLDAWQYQTADPVKLFEAPSMRANAKGWLSARFVCHATGNGDVALRDPDVGTRYVSVLGAVTRPQDTTYCVA